MPKRISNETKEEIMKLYDNGSGLSPIEIARQTGVSYPSVYGLTRVRQRVNPETGQPFESRSQYQDYRERQKVNRPENQGLGGLIRRRLKNLGKNQSWLAEEIGVTRQSVSLYVKGRSVPKDDLLQKLYSSLDVQYGILDDLLEDFDNE